MTSAETWLVADLGGTHLRLALTDVPGEGHPSLRELRTYRAAEAQSLAAAGSRYLNETGARAAGAVVCAAGHVVARSVELTNLSWRVNGADLEQAWAMRRVEVVNDLAGAASALAWLDDAEAPLLWPSPALPARDERRCVVVSPGTGLGVAAATLRAGAQIEVVDTEGGHAGFAPRSELEWELAHAMQQRDGNRVSWEHWVSGPGLVRIHQALALRAGGAPIDSGPRAPEEIVAAAGRGDRLSAQALALFGQALAAVAGDCVLMHGAWHGVYLMGALVQALRDHWDDHALRARFADKGPFAVAMAAVPVRCVVHPHPVLLGAAHRARQSARGGAPLVA
jgi:glucokinase